MISVGAVLANRYKVVRPLGGGAMKQVYLAQDTRLANRPCALAEMIDSFANPDAQQQAIAAFTREADILAALSHEHIVRVYDRFSEANRHYLVMEYVQGKTLEERIHAAGGKLAESITIDVALQILDALEYLHGHAPPIIYRDLKPSNIIVMPNGRVKLIDFGIARLFQPQTRGTLIGTPGYAAPEQYKGAAEPRSDLYALGALMHFMLTGRDPSSEPPFMFPPIEKLRPDLKPPLAGLVGEALAFDGNMRISSAGEFRRRLDRMKVGQTADPLAIAAAHAAARAHRSATAQAAVTLTEMVCARCSRDIPADASLCPYCGASLLDKAESWTIDSAVETARLGGANVPIAKKRKRWPLVVTGLGALTAAVFAATAYYENIYLPQQQVVVDQQANASPEAQPSVAGGEAAPEQPRHEDIAAAERYATLSAQLAQDVTSLRHAKAGSARENQLREDAISTALQMNPPPAVPDEAQQLIDQGESDLKIANTPSEYRRAAAQLDQGLRIAPWDAPPYQALADARERSADYSKAIGSLKYYLLANPQASDASQVRGKVADLEQLQLKAQQEAEEQRKLALLQKEHEEAERSNHEVEAAAQKAVEEQHKAEPMAAVGLRTQRALPCGAGEEPARTYVSVGRTFRDCAECPEMVVVPAGSFCMGSPSSEPGRYEVGEGPQHEVTISYGFAVGKYPITRDEYERFTSETMRPHNNPWYAQTGRDPVVNVTWVDAKAYTAWLSEKTGHAYRLLSASEYEYAERAGTTTAYWWGDDWNCSHANGVGCGHESTVPAGSYPPNAFGLYDMAGNVWEWTEDCYHASYEGAPDDGTPWTAGDCTMRVLRGGTWYPGVGYPRSARGGGFYSDYSHYSIDGGGGFRVARTM